MDREPLEGIDYYIENGLLVFTAQYLRDRGYCCTSGCRHCPYGYERFDPAEIPDDSRQKNTASANRPQARRKYFTTETLGNRRN